MIKKGAINIKHENLHNCIKKCEFNYNYEYTFLKYEKKGNYLSYKFVDNNKSTIKLGNTNYIPDEMVVYTPSLHKYNGDSVIGEILIYHINTSSYASKPLIVCIPLQKINSTNKCSQALNNIIYHPLKKNIQKTQINNITFSINDILKEKKSYYYYEGKIGKWERNTNGANLVVFTSTRGSYSASIDENTYKELQKISNNNEGGIKHNFTNRENEKELFYNSKGSKQSIDPNNDGIYIDCRPTGEDGNVLIPIDKSIGEDSINIPFADTILDNSTINTILLYKTLFLQFLFGAIIMGILLYGVIYLLNKLADANKRDNMRIAGIE